MAMVREVKTMSVELAIRRELAYREKVAAFLSEKEITALLPLEVPSPKTQDEVPLLALEGPKYEDEVENGESTPNAIDKSIQVTEISSDIEIHASEVPLLALEGPKSEDEVEKGESTPNAIDKSIQVTEISSDIEIHASEVPLLALEGPKSEDEVEKVESTLNAKDKSIQVTEEARQSSRLEILEKKRKEVLPSTSNTFQNHSRRPNSTSNWRPSAANGVTISPSASSLGFLPKPDGSAFFCHLCKVDCTSSFNYKNHVRGHKHKAKLKYGQLMRNKRNKKGHFPCEVCEIWCEGEDSLRLHLNGRKHMVKLLEAKLADQQ